MKALLICPGQRPGVAALTETAPLAITTCLGKSPAEYWLAHLATLGVRQVRVLVADRPDQVRQRLGDGSQWGLRIDVLPETHELTADEARAKYHPCHEPDWVPEPNDVIVADRLPGLPQQPLATHYADWFAALVAWIPNAATPDRIGLREIKPGVWCGLHSRVSPRAQLHPPCWLGESVWIGPDAVVGPEAVVEDRVFVDARAEVAQSAIGPETYVGQLAQVRDSLVYGNTLINWRTGWCSEVSDAFLLSRLDSREAAPKRVRFLGRTTALVGMGLTLPFALWVMARSLLRGQPTFESRLAMRPREPGGRGATGPVVYHELAAANGWLRRWPQFWNVVRGEFAWVGNRPLDPANAARLANDFERLWLAAPIGLVSLADANACADPLSDEARAHASFYAVCASPRLDCSILWRAASVSLNPPRPQRATHDYAAPLSRWRTPKDHAPIESAYENQT